MALNILAVTSEAFPLAKTGGLGDAVSGMSVAVAAAGPNITLMLPAYRGTLSQLTNVQQVAKFEDLPGGPARLLQGHCSELGLPVLLLENDLLYDRDGIYVDADSIEYADNALRFAALAQAAARVAQGLPGIVQPDVVHAHDWHAGLTPLYMNQLGVAGVKSILTLHNVAFQGVYPMELADALGIDARYCDDAGLEFWGQMNFLKAGIRYADLVTVVSNNYAREILTPEFGCGLEGVLAAKGKDLIAIPNGIDTSWWNPENDRYLGGNSFTVNRMGNKARCKARLQAYFDLKPDSGMVLMAMCSRLTTQKMADVAAYALPMALDTHPNLQVVIMGQGDKSLETALLGVAAAYPGRCSVRIGYDEKHAHWLHAGADILLHGSRFEPFGLTPLYAMRYGTLPIGSRVGGMADTILDPGPDAPPAAMHKATGLLFQGEQAADMAAAIDRAVALKGLPVVWRAMQLNAMRADFSWEKTAPAYISSYQALRPDVVTDRIPESLAGAAMLRKVQGSPGIPATLAARLRNGASSHVATQSTGAARPFAPVATVTQGASLV